MKHGWRQRCHCCVNCELVKGAEDVTFSTLLPCSPSVQFVKLADGRQSDGQSSHKTDESYRWSQFKGKNDVLRMEDDGLDGMRLN